MPRALVITTAGINCDLELGHAFESAGCAAEFVHLNRLLDRPALVNDFDLIGIPGGFSYGDSIAAGRIAAQLMRRTLYPAFVRAIERGAPIIAPCNGFQIVAQMGLLPGPALGEPWPAAPPRPSVALAQNESARFIDRWCAVEVPANTRCIWTQGLAGLGTEDSGLSGPTQSSVPSSQSLSHMLPIAHGEGRFMVESNDLIHRLDESGQIALRYSPSDNPNGSTADIAGICDATGLVFGLMPHPERFTQWTHHPSWSRLNDKDRSGQPLGLRIFRNAVAHVTQRRHAVAK